MIARPLWVRRTRGGRFVGILLLLLLGGLIVWLIATVSVKPPAGLCGLMPRGAGSCWLPVVRGRSWGSCRDRPGPRDQRLWPSEVAARP